MTNLTERWWSKNVETGKRYELVFGAINRLTDAAKERTGDYMRYEMLYEGAKKTYRGRDATLAYKDMNDEDKRLRLNIARSVVDSLLARICGQRPKPRFLTDDAAEYSITHRARQLDKFIEAEFRREKVWEKTKSAFRNAAVVGSGFLKIYPDYEDKKVRVERVYPSSVIVDDTVATVTPPRTLYHVMLVDADVLRASYPKKDAIIYEAKTTKSDIGWTEFSDDDGKSDLITVVEAWHLPSSSKSKDGRRVVSIVTGDLLDEEFTEDDFPFVHVAFSERESSWYGQGVVEQIMAPQAEVQRLIRKIQKNMDIHATVKTFVEEGSIVRGKQTNDPLDMVEYKMGARPPDVRATPSMPSDVFRFVQYLKQQCYELTGISELSATGRKPADVESGKALRTLLDAETNRFSLQYQIWEELHLSVARKMINAASKLYEGSTSYKVKYVAGDYIETIDWAEVNLERDQYVLALYPTNLLPTQPAGRLATIDEMSQSGLFSTEELRELLDFPDLSRAMSLNNAALRFYDQIVERIILGKIRVSDVEPTEEENLELGIVRFQLALNKARLDGVPPEITDQLRRWIHIAQFMLGKRTQHPDDVGEYDDLAPPPTTQNDMIPPIPQEIIPEAQPAPMPPPIQA